MMTCDKLFLFSILIFAISASAEPGDRVYAVEKNDGTVSYYRLNPVHFDARQGERLQARLSSLANLSRADLPASFEMAHSRLPAARDQGARGSCAYFGTVGILEAYYMAKSLANQQLALSEECLLDVRDWMYDQGTQYTGDDKPERRPDPNGDFPASVIKTITGHGVPASGAYGAIDCRYSEAGDNGMSLTDYKTAVSSSVIPFGKGLLFDENRAPTIDAIRELIAGGHPVEVIFLVYPEYSTSADWRYNAALDTDANIAGAHAVILTGYQTGAEGTLFTFKNSWGPNWGANGYGKLDDKLLIHGWGYDPTLDFVVSLHD